MHAPLYPSALYGISPGRWHSPRERTSAEKSDGITVKACAGETELSSPGNEHTGHSAGSPFGLAALSAELTALGSTPGFMSLGSCLPDATEPRQHGWHAQLERCCCSPSLCAAS